MNGYTGTTAAVVVLILLSGFFSATETAFSSLNRIRVKNAAEKGSKKYALVLRLSDNYDRLLSTILIGNNIVNIACASLSTMLFVRLLGDDAGPGVSTAVTTVAVLIFGEVTPKSIAKEMPERFAAATAPVVNALAVLCTPFNYLFGQWKKLVSLVFKPREDRVITEEELLSIVDEVQQEGGLDEQESTIIRSAIEFSELEARDILTPRTDLTAVPVGATREEIAALFSGTGFSRLPVYDGGIDNICGIIYHKDFYNRVYVSGAEISSIIRPVYYITEDKRIGDLLGELQRAKSHMAVVVDEFGGTVGIVTLEDILEEIVGEIWDEHDNVVEEISEPSEGEYIVLGGANIDKLFERLGIDEQTDSVTVGGWITGELGHLPEKDDSFVWRNLAVRVLEADGKRVEKAEIRVLYDEDGDGSGQSRAE